SRSLKNSRAGWAEIRLGCIVHSGKAGERGSSKMATLGQAVCALEEQLFVGRESELASFRHWLGESSARPEIFNVSGPGGVGKSALLAAFRRMAVTAARPIISADAS